ncbi:MAG TPA: ATP synthase F1 subunit gamma [Chloroflexota bacterium]
MASLRDIRRRIRGVKSIAQVTKAMQMVAATRMRRAQQRALDSRPYADAIREMVIELGSDRPDPLSLHPLQQIRPERRVAFMVFTSDRGLCGPLNGNVIRRAATEILAQTEDPHLVTVGRKGQDFFARRGRHIQATFTGLERPEYDDVIPISRVIIDEYEQQSVDAVYLVYPEFVTALTQRPVVSRILPIVAPEAGGTQEAGGHLQAPGEFIIEPSTEEILDTLLPRYVEVQVYRALLETAASEHSARMAAMRAATENALELVQGLTLAYNKARQAAITREIIEISGAAEAMAKAS